MSEKNVKSAKMTGFFAELMRDERGQSTVEYILMLSAVVMIAMKFKTAFSKQVDSMVNKVTGEINQGMENN